MKKILASLMALAMFVSVAVVMVGCGNNVNGEYKFSHATFTVITKVDEDGKVTETKTYSEEEYVKIVYVWAAVDASKTAEEALEKALNNNCELAILKAKSPSCGCGKIYDGTFTSTLIEGDGITTRLFKQHNIKVYTEEEI